MFQLRREIDILQIPQKKFYDIDHCPNYNRKALGITLTEIYSRVNQVEIRSRRRTEILRMAIETVQRLQRPFKGHFKAIETIQRPQRPLKSHRDHSKAIETVRRPQRPFKDYLKTIETSQSFSFHWLMTFKQFFAQRFLLCKTQQSQVVMRRYTKQFSQQNGPRYS